MTKGSFAFVLHSHLPYVLSHGRWPHGSDWLCEAAAETYLPIIKILRELQAAGKNPKLTIGLSPVLCEQLCDQTFKTEFVSYLNLKLKSARDDIKEFIGLEQHNLLDIARFWENWYSATIEHFDRLNQNIVNEFKKLQSDGLVEIISCGATHGYYPLLSKDESLQVQTKAAVKNYEKHFGQKPKGIWLPECAYRPSYDWTPPVPVNGKQESRKRKGADEFLSESGIEFFIVDSALLKGGQAIGAYLDRFESLRQLFDQYQKSAANRPEEKDKTPYEVYLVASDPRKKPVAVFSRNPETGLLVWLGKHGYPGESDYLEFHKKRWPSGHKYWAVTSAKSELDEKSEYNREAALSRIAENASDFVLKVEELLGEYHSLSGKPGIIVSPYDTELFGHWWFEGPMFLKHVLSEIEESSEVETVFLSDYLEKTKPGRLISLPEGSWGEGNHHFIWLNQENEWTWKLVYESEEKMVELACYWTEHADKSDNELKDILLQLGRELMLMSASDWQFLISTKAASDYAELRLKEHYEDFVQLAALADKKIAGESLTVDDREFFNDCQKRDNLFPELEIEWFAGVEFPAKVGVA
ncbi:MAG: DUF1957 domain-containing protein [candidate division Zixibacteria bacterium]|nr:DUF1957 domain-containing protein [candidate division Zixibacteria bacterium]